MDTNDNTQSNFLQQLNSRTNNSVASLTVRFDDSHVVIGGKAPSYYMKQVVTQTALAAAGTRQVRNEIAVCPDNFDSQFDNWN